MNPEDQNSVSYLFDVYEGGNIRTADEDDSPLTPTVSGTSQYGEDGLIVFKGKSAVNSFN